MKNNLNIRIGHRVKFSGGNSQLVPNGCDYSLEGKVTGFHENHDFHENHEFHENRDLRAGRR